MYKIQAQLLFPFHKRQELTLWSEVQTPHRFSFLSKRYLPIESSVLTAIQLNMHRARARSMLRKRKKFSINIASCGNKYWVVIGSRVPAECMQVGAFMLPIGGEMKGSAPFAFKI